MYTHSDDKIQLLVRVTVSCDGITMFPALVMGWVMDNLTCDGEMNVSYATYSKVFVQEVGPDTPDIDALADKLSELEIALEESVKKPLAYEKSVHYISPAIAIWNSSSEE